MLTQKSAGFIVFKKEGKGFKFLLLHHGGDYWNFPKGRLDPGETEIEAAKRELEEETGITKIKIIDGYKDEYKYDFDTTVEDGSRQTIYKTAVFFLAEVDDEKINISDEHTDFGWYDYQKAHQRLFYQNGQDLLKRAHEFLSKKQDFVL